MTVHVKRNGVWIDAESYQVGDRMKLLPGFVNEVKSVGVKDGVPHMEMAVVRDDEPPEDQP